MFTKAPEWTTITGGREGWICLEQLASLLVQKVRGSFVTPHPCTAPLPILHSSHYSCTCTSTLIALHSRCKSHTHKALVACLVFNCSDHLLQFEFQGAMQCNAKECTAKVKFPRAILCHLLGNPQRWGWCQQLSYAVVNIFFAGVQKCRCLCLCFPHLNVLSG